MSQPDFLSKPMSKMTESEWESICDGCGLCCQMRVEDVDSKEKALSNVACRYLCLNSHRCTDYANRQKNVTDCVEVTPSNIHELTWLPNTCGYRLVANNMMLPEWHHLICGDPEQVHISGPSMKDSLVSEDEADWEQD